MTTRTSPERVERFKRALRAAVEELTAHYSKKAQEKRRLASEAAATTALQVQCFDDFRRMGIEPLRAARLARQFPEWRAKRRAKP